MRNPRAIGATVATLALIAVPLVAQAGTNTPAAPATITKMCKNTKTKALYSKAKCNAGDIAVTLASVQGAQGVPGKSAYDLAIAGGFTGTQAEWLTSLNGKDGAPGAPGKDGAVGPAGKDGEKGDKGEPGDSAGIVRKCATVQVNSDYVAGTDAERTIKVSGLPAYSDIDWTSSEDVYMNGDLVAANIQSVEKVLDTNLTVEAITPKQDGTTFRTFLVTGGESITGGESANLTVCVARLSLA